MSGETPVLRVEGLSVSYRRGRDLVPAVEDVSFSLSAGETVAIVGGSGSGKSTTAHAIVGLLARNAEIASGRIVVDGNEITALRERELARLRGRVVGLVPQDPTLSLDPVLTVGYQVAEALIVHRLARRAEARAQAVELLERVGIDRPELRFRQFPHQLSGGQRQRVLIAIAIAARPPLIVADEATSGLDVTVQARVLDQLADLARERGTATVLITHDLGVAADRADTVLVLERGRLVEHGPVDEVVTAPRHAYTRALFEAAPSIAARVGETVKAPAPSEEALSAPPIASVRDLRKDFVLRSEDGSREILRSVAGVSFDIVAGSTLAIVGESGSGKTTTARILGGFETATSGEVHVDGVDLHDGGPRERRELRRRVQFVFQSPYASLDPRFTVAQIVEEPLRSFRVGDRASRGRRVRELVDEVQLPADFADRRPGELSGGQRQRVAIARALALEPRLLILDEPVSALDVSVQRIILDLLAELQREQGLSYLFISHDLAVVRQIAHEAIVLRAGEVQERGTVEELFASPRTAYTRELLDAIPGRRLETR
ncbi:ABC transporter ATP-binding protein [Microbacterium betulae]|uniref:ABC transporter ATP-binding protein n=1 Tax=Microbacterium betulae TaxID=2981139 RepID=A0AA97FH32_9MICO|nr:ABC transporter ATP-binding protein [Microbacterium sp. AB]WOF22783.1 ABC transporter ATP-binding protein [Microbacterium sp. AB]